MHLGLTTFITFLTVIAIPQNSPNINESQTHLEKLENINSVTHTGEQVS
jgi:hypothetical protein